ncbi:MAG: hypothetical protein ACRDWI_10090 [Jiangellaceae bacterium]
MATVSPAHRVRQVVNVVNLSTPIGLLVGALGRVRFRLGPNGLVLGYGYRLVVPRNSTFTVGNVVLFKADETVHAKRPTLMAHEARHATQYAFCLGPVMLPLYGLAAAWSWVRTGDPASRNVFERLAGLADGGYRERPVRPLFRRRRGGSGRF